MNYSNISRALDFYGKRGYVYLPEVPWRVGREAYYMTRPEGSVDVMVHEGKKNGPNESDSQYLVASGEQSFIQMMLDGQQLKRAICVTPCFRHERRMDMLHHRYFMKAELINAHNVDDGHLIDMVHDACSFFEEMGVSVRVIPTSHLGEMPSYDIVEKGTRYELGSYGIRNVCVNSKLTLNWIYGTACAEPRLSTVMGLKTSLK